MESFSSELKMSSGKRGRPRGKPPRRSEDVDSLIPKGLSLEGMVKFSHYKGKAGVWDYLNRTKQLRDWHRSKPSYLSPVSLLVGAVGSRIIGQLSTPLDNIANVVSMVQIRAYKRAGDDERRAFDYLQFEIKSTHNWAGPLHRYFVAREKGEKPTLRQLCDGFEALPGGLSRIRRVLGLKPLSKSGRLPKKKADVRKVLFDYREGQGEAAELTYIFFEDYDYSYYYNPDSVLKVITMCLTANKIRKRISLSELGRAGRISVPGISRIFDFFGWQKMYKPSLRLTSEHKAMIQRAFPLEMTVQDIAYFCPVLNKELFEKYFSKIGKRPRKASWTTCLGPVRTNRRASQVYELDDQRLSGGEKMFDREEIAEFLGTTLRKVNYALGHRRIIGAKIIHALRVMYDNPRIKTPYLSGGYGG